MKLAGIFRFELAYQLRRPWPWLCTALLAVFAFFNTRVAVVPATLPQDFILNSPFIIAAVTVFTCQVWLLIAPVVAGEAAARDVHTGMHPLIYTSPISRWEYVGGRFLAALAINALILLGVQLGSLLAAHAPGANPEIIGAFRAGAYAAAYVQIALTNALIATAIQFAASLRTGRPMASYAGSLGLFFLSYPVTFALYFSPLGNAALMTDPIGVFAIMDVMMREWTIIEKNVRMFVLEGPMLVNRLLWLFISLLTIALVYARFGFAHRTVTPMWQRVMRPFARRAAAPVFQHARPAIDVPRVRLAFGARIQLRQAAAIATSSFRMMATSPVGLFTLVIYPVFVVLVLVMESQHWGVPLLPRTGYVLSTITSPLTEVSDFRVIIPLLLVYLVGELVWRERNIRLSENVDATSVPEWVMLAGKYLGVALLLSALMLALMCAGMLAQVLRGYHDFQPDLYLFVLFGLQLPEYLLFAMLAFFVHTIVNDKYAGMLAGLVAFALIIFAPVLGIEHSLLVFSSGPAWSFTDMRGFGFSLGPWLWLKLYWAAWALLLAVAARTLWVRGREWRLGARLRIARQRVTRATVGTAAVAGLLIVSLGGFVFYNTNVLNEYRTSDDAAARSAEYERRYGKYEGAAQPVRSATKLHIEIHPERGAAIVVGSYTLVNPHTVAIDSVHVETVGGFDTRVSLDRGASLALDDRDLGHTIYELASPLLPGDTMTLDFEVHLSPRGFRSSGAPTPIVPNGTHFTGRTLPVIGYQPSRKLISADDRRRFDLPREVTFPSPEDVDPEVASSSAATFEAIIGTAANQVAVAPGVLRREWTDGARRYFHYSSDAPIRGLFVFFSAAYNVHRELHNGVEIQVYNDPRHTAVRDRLLRSTRESLDYYSSQFGPYPYHFLQVIEQPAKGLGMGVDGSGVITGLEGFFRLSPTEDDDVDAVFQIVAHEMAHQWWGVQLNYAPAEGAIVLSEGLAWYSAMQAVKHANGPAQLRRFMSFMRQPHPWRPIRTGLPLLRAMDPWAGYRKAPYALYALSEYIGKARVNGALRTLLKKQGATRTTTLELYRELQAVTPDSMQYLLRDLFERDAFWELEARAATASQIADGQWQVAIDVRARKVVSDSAGAESELPMDELIPVGIFADGAAGDELGTPLYLRMHRIRAGEQTITVIVPRRPVLAGVDPHHLLDWVEEEDDDNIAAVTVKQ